MALKEFAHPIHPVEPTQHSPHTADDAKIDEMEKWCHHRNPFYEAHISKQVQQEPWSFAPRPNRIHSLEVFVVSSCLRCIYGSFCGVCGSVETGEQVGLTKIGLSSRETNDRRNHKSILSAGRNILLSILRVMVRTWCLCVFLGRNRYVLVCFTCVWVLIRNTLSWEIHNE